PLTPAARFLRLLEERGEVTTAEAMTALGFDDPRGLGGIVGSTNRWAASPVIAVRVNAEGEKVFSLVRRRGR
ncbi:MAG TPA: hypothetical protein VHF22_12395, partial [Planctomycetota bacterium]|nr:hypothetical protein [Planctomycetota bacterium]